MANGLWPERFDLIDAWRGLAALAVVIHHVAHIFIGGPAVMLFFVISGYCIAASADSCHRRGFGFGTFMMRRIRRIYPPYLLSLMFWTITRVAKWYFSGVNDMAQSLHGVPRTAVDWVQNVTLTQWLSLLRNPLPSAAENQTLFVAAYWSLCYEEQFYLLTGLMLAAASVFKVTIRSMVTALIVVGLVWNVLFPQICYGVFIEYWALFGLGALVFYRLCRSTPAQRRLIDAGLIAVFLGAAALRFLPAFNGSAPWAVDAPGLSFSKRAELRLVYEELLIGAGFAMLLILMRPLSEKVRGRLWYKPFAALGMITFSLYLIHQFNLNFIRAVTDRLFGMVGLMTTTPDGGREPSIVWLSLTVQILLHIGLASIFWCFCERPFLNRPLAAKPKDQVPAPAPSPAT